MAETVQAAPAKDALGRNWRTASRAELTEFPEGDALITLTWEDGAVLRQYEDTPDQARSTLRRLGFTVPVKQAGCTQRVGSHNPQKHQE
jgi:hypothetical protein